MCAQFILEASLQRLSRVLGIKDAPELEWNSRILPYQKAPIIVSQGGQRCIQLMQFSLVPAWSKERKVRFATHNARLSTYDEKKKRNVPIYEKPTWRDAFAKRHCLVPLTEFIEPIYTGTLAGNMVRFSGREQEILVAAGLWEKWTSKDTGETLNSFTIITDDPIPFVEKTGHDRSPIFLNSDSFDSWLHSGGETNQERVQFLRSHIAQHDWTAEKDRPLRPGWEKRIPD